MLNTVFELFVHLGQNALPTDPGCAHYCPTELHGTVLNPISVLHPTEAPVNPAAAAPPPPAKPPLH